MKWCPFNFTYSNFNVLLSLCWKVYKLYGHVFWTVPNGTFWLPALKFSFFGSGSSQLWKRCSPIGLSLSVSTYFLIYIYIDSTLTIQYTSESQSQAAECCRVDFGWGVLDMIIFSWVSKEKVNTQFFCFMWDADTILLGKGLILLMGLFLAGFS